MKEKLIYITGGARSGKSSFAENLIMERGHRVLYIATAIPFDREMRERIKRHKQERPSFWYTLEAYREIGQCLDRRAERFHGILLDCITVMITNLLMDEGCESGEWTRERLERIETAIMSEVDSAVAGMRTWGDMGVVVSNEVGMGLVPDNPLGRVFRDIAGRVNQYLAAEADRGYLMVSGIPVRIK
jgi:adenosylcobinamide kinase/adenosylcobinamide-phosphate guanylyltransferase